MRIMFVMISMICVSCSIVIVDMLNTFKKNKHYRFRKMEMEVFVKIPVIGTVAYNYIKGNKVHQPNILIYFNIIFNVIQRTMIVR